MREPPSTSRKKTFKTDPWKEFWTPVVSDLFYQFTVGTKLLSLIFLRRVLGRIANITRAVCRSEVLAST